MRRVRVMLTIDPKVELSDEAWARLLATSAPGWPATTVHFDVLGADDAHEAIETLSEIARVSDEVVPELRSRLAAIFAIVCAPLRHTPDRRAIVWARDHQMPDRHVTRTLAMSWRSDLDVPHVVLTIENYTLSNGRSDVSHVSCTPDPSALHPDADAHELANLAAHLPEILASSRSRIGEMCQNARDALDLLERSKAVVTPDPIPQTERT